jgi:hypothetical protein
MLLSGIWRRRLKMTRDGFLDVLRSWLGVHEPDHRFIIDIYNDFFDAAGNRPRGYRVTYFDAWCATCASAAAIEAGGASTTPLECGCEEMINLFKKQGRYVSGNAYAPEKGDFIFYDWQGDGHADHVGVVEICDGTNITVIEGNNNDAVRRRTLRVGASYVRGYGRPIFEEAAPAPIPEHIPDEEPADGNHVYRLYNPTTGEHFYTESVGEGNALIDAGWSFEGSAWIAPKESGAPVYRLINSAGWHMYALENEKKVLVESGWKEEGIAFYSCAPTDLPIVPIYRIYNPGTGDHLFAANLQEYYNLVSVGWTGEGIRFYGLR